MSNADSLASIRDQMHKLLSGLVDDIRSAERASVETERALAGKAEELSSAADLAISEAKQAKAETAKLEAKLAQAVKDYFDNETRLQSRIEDLEGQLAAVEPERQAFRDQTAAFSRDLMEERRKLMDTERVLAATRDELSVARKAREEAERHEGMFRRALFTYLQEREGPAGSNAPTPETLDLIRKLVGSD